MNISLHPYSVLLLPKRGDCAGQSSVVVVWLLVSSWESSSTLRLFPVGPRWTWKVFTDSPDNAANHASTESRRNSGTKYFPLRKLLQAKMEQAMAAVLGCIKTVRGDPKRFVPLRTDWQHKGHDLLTCCLLGKQADFRDLEPAQGLLGKLHCWKKRLNLLRSVRENKEIELVWRQRDKTMT